MRPNPYTAGLGGNFIMSTLLTLITVVHLLTAVVLIGFVLLQDPKGGGAMGVFGGGSGSNTLFGSTGAGNFLTAVTKGSAILFAVTCIALTYIISHPGGSVLDQGGVTAPKPTTTEQPSEPEAPPAESK